MNMHKLCVLLNGPPGIGKDTLADLLTADGFTKHMFKACLYRKTAEYFNVSTDLLTARAQDRILKEKPWGMTMWLGEAISPRDALIHVSEVVIKPEYGDTFFGVAAAKVCVEQNTQLAVFSDSGFRSEVAPLLELFQSVLIVRLYREGFTFRGDSREYLTGFQNMVDLQLFEDGEEEALSDLRQYIFEHRVELSSHS